MIRSIQLFLKIKDSHQHLVETRCYWRFRNRKTWARQAKNLVDNVLNNLNSGVGMSEKVDESRHTNSVISPDTVSITGNGDATTDATSNHRLKGALALKAGYDAYKLSAALPGLADAANGSIHATQDVLAKKTPDPDAKGEGFGISVSLGMGQSKQDSKNRATQARGTTAQASTINITSREGDIRMEGAKLQAHDISLDAARNIHLIAATNTTDVQSTNSGSNVGLGATLGSNGQQTGLSFQIGASASKGHTNGYRFQERQEIPQSDFFQNPHSDFVGDICGALQWGGRDCNRDRHVFSNQPEWWRKNL